FRRLFAAGMTALLADVVGFAVLTIVDVPVIQELAIIASVGVGILVFTNLALLPIMLSYTGVSALAAARSLKLEAGEAGGPRLLGVFERFTGPRPAALALLVALGIGLFAVLVGRELKVGDLDP